MKVLVTGGCGYIGSYLIPYLARHHNAMIDELVIYDNLSGGDPSLLFGTDTQGLKIRLIKDDILNTNGLIKALKGIDTVIHLAAKITQPFTDVNLHIFDQVNNWGTASVADAIEQSEVKRVIYLSSIVIYGTSSKDFEENSKPEPITYYGLSKLKGEKQIQRVSGVEQFILRTANVYGYSPAMRIDSVINRFMFEGHFFGQVNKVSDGEQSRAFIHIDKLAYSLCHILKGDVPEGLYNIAEHNWSVNELLSYMKQVFPDLDVITVDQDAKLEHVNMKTPTSFQDHVHWEQRPILEELEEMKDAFSF